MRLIRLIFALLATASVPARADWQRVDTEHFTVYADTRPDKARDYALELERFDMLARHVFALGDREPGMKLTVFALDTDGQVRAVFGDNSGNVGGFYVPAAGGALAVVPRATGSIQTGEIVLRHEYAHHLMMQYFPSTYPIWYVEGFADFLSTASFDKQDFASLGTPPAARWMAARNGPQMPLERLLTANRGTLKGPQTSALYAEGWMLTHYLSVSGERPGQLSRYLDLLAGGRPNRDAATEAFGPLDQLQNDYDRYREQSRLNYFHIAQPFVYRGAATVTALDAAGQQTIRERIALMRGVPRERRLALATELERAAAQFPDNAETFAMLAQARLLLGEHDAAKAAADKALALDPDLGRAALWRALAEAARLQKAGNRDTEAWKAARADIIRANRAAPNDPLPLYENFRIYTRLGLEPSATAKQGLARAYQLLPQHVGVRFTYARLLARASKPDAAITLLQPLANNPHGGNASEDAARMIEALRARQPVPDPPSETPGADED
ncbi:hypothetical protein [Sphingomonas sanxanigenens]|uniref:Uncharacterized protein n=1 Tax=Sphingomonas sanxanigenens DSM 19645 = NX02 TaxID=1123269 RepID=W0ACZ3_9SPHN|nr:hypothetical protein [Sphingomonas sanxanigenens]AHE53525.1 hypothetical protein NX02_09015 [Sphingomonas sanxanigenens DSM 19645 = NX02]